MKRPGGWVDGIGWVALGADLPDGTEWLSPFSEHKLFRKGRVTPHDCQPVIVTRWADGTIPEPPEADEDEYERGYIEGQAVVAKDLLRFAALYGHAIRDQS